MIIIIILEPVWNDLTQFWAEAAGNVGLFYVIRKNKPRMSGPTERK